MINVFIVSRYIASMRFVEVNTAKEDVIEQQIVSVIGMARNRLQMSTHLSPLLFNSGPISQAFEEVLPRIKRFEIVIGSNVNIANRRAQISWFDKALDSGKTVVKKADTAVPEWILADRKNFCIQKIPRGGNQPMLNIFKANFVISEIITDKFDDLWHNAALEFPEILVF